MIYALNADEVATLCELCGKQCCHNPYDNDERLKARNDAVSVGWLFNYDGQHEYAICPACQERNK